MLYIIDFAIATNNWVSETGTESDWNRAYTLAYAPPEVIAWETQGPPADVFALGAVFTLMSTLISRRSVEEFDNFRETSSPYYPEETTTAFHSSIGKVENWLMRRQVASNKLIVQMLSKDPEHRPTALEVVSALRSINGFPTCDCILQVSPP
jgi:serine/threonine protein kinase